MTFDKQMFDLSIIPKGYGNNVHAGSQISPACLSYIPKNGAIPISLLVLKNTLEEKNRSN